MHIAAALSFLVLCSLTPNVTRAQARPPGPMVEVRVVGPRGVWLHEAGSRCSLPCELTLAARTHRFGLSLTDASVNPTDAIEIQRPGLLRAQYTDKSGLRTAGWAVFATGISLAVAGVVLGGLADSLDTESPDEEDDLGLNVLTLSGYAAGAVTLLIALAVGLPLATLADGASIRFE